MTTGWSTLALMTLYEAGRRRLAATSLVLATACLVLFGLGLHVIHGDVMRSVALSPLRRSMALNMAFVSALYVANLLIVMTSILIPIETLAGEIASGALQTIATKPLSRTTIVLGKWLGCLGLEVAYVAFIYGGLVTLARLLSGYAPHDVALGFGLLVLEGTLLMTLALALGSRLSPLATGAMAFGLHGVALIGGWIEHAGTLAGNAAARDLGIATSLLVPSEALWRLAAYHLQGPLLRDVGLTPFSGASVPSPAMVLWAGLYVAVVLAASVRAFGRRSL